MQRRQIDYDPLGRIALSEEGQKIKALTDGTRYLSPSLGAPQGPPFLDSARLAVRSSPMPNLAPPGNTGSTIAGARFPISCVGRALEMLILGRAERVDRSR